MKGPVVLLSAVLLSLLITISGLADDGGRFLFPALAPEIEVELKGRDAARLRGLSQDAYDERWDELARNAAALGEGLARASHRDPRPFAIVAAYRAVAAAALGEDADAVWHWQAALNLSPDIDYAELTRAGTMFPALMEVGLPPARGSRPASESESQSLPADVRPPSEDPRTKVRLDFLVGPFRDATTPPFIFSAQLWVGVDGRFHSPRVLTSSRERGAETYSALESLRRWRFTPGMQNGEPVEFQWSIQQHSGTGRLR
jgi:hypothetical protein